MNILFLSLSRFTDVSVRGIYSDLMREFLRRGNKVYIASPTERRFGKPTSLIVDGNVQILKIKTLNIQKTNVIEKGIATLLLEYQFDNAINRYWGNVPFDLVLYATPPITFNRVIMRIKSRCGARSYLMLKDIFPQNAVDIGMMRSDSFIHRLFRRKERRLYQISDRIGCMSPANCRYVTEHNPDVDPAKVELCPNAIETIDIKPVSDDDRNLFLQKYGIPADRTLFVYGGKLGKPQGVDFLLKVIEANEQRSDSFIIVVGSGTEFHKIESFFAESKPTNAVLMQALPKDEYDKLVRLCHVGLIFLDPRFTIPNFPSRLLSYLENAMPVLLATDPNTDMGRIAESEQFGLSTLNGDIKTFVAHMNALSDVSLRRRMGIQGRKYLCENYTVSRVADIIERSVEC